MTYSLCSANNDELEALSALCQRSKSFWGYDDDFMRACTHELTLVPEDLAPQHTNQADFITARRDAKLAGLAQISVLDKNADLTRLYVDPEHMGQGVGRILFSWASKTAKSMGASYLLIVSDPNAAAFYRHMGAHQIGQSQSDSIPGRMLPLLSVTL